MTKIWGGLSGREKRFLSIAMFCFVLAVVAGVAWHLRLKPMSTEWGDVATWVAVAAAGFGLLYTGRSLRQQTAQRAEEATRLENAQEEVVLARARSVAVRSQWSPVGSHEFKAGEGMKLAMKVRWTLSNSTSFPLDNVVVATPLDGGNNHYFMAGTVLPGQTITEHTHWVEALHVNFQDQLDVSSVLFTDVYGRHWHRGPNLLRERYLAADLDTVEGVLDDL